MKFFKYIFICIFVSFLGACSDSLDFKVNNSDYYNDGLIHFDITLPDPQKVSTRAGEDIVNERKINSLTLLFFNNEKVLKKIVPVTEEMCDNFNDDTNTTYRDASFTSFSLKVNKGEISGNETLYVVANYDVSTNLTEGESQIGALDNITENALQSGVFVMSGKLDNVSLANPNTVALYRNAAKVSVSENSTVKGVSLISVKNVANAGKITAYHQNSEAAVNDFSESVNAADGVAYVYPTGVRESNNAMMIVYAPFNGNFYYYRLDFLKQKEGSQDELEPMKIEPNHWYELIVESVEAPGYEKPELAAVNSAANNVTVKVNIHDHAPNVFSMASDGIRELGVKTPIQYVENFNGEDSQAYLYVRAFSAIDGEVEETTIKSQISVSVTNGSGWLSVDTDNVVIIKNGAELNYHDDVAGEANADTANKGLILKYPLIFNESPTTDDKTAGEITVEWSKWNLSRLVKVEWETDYNGRKIADVKLTIHKGTGGETVVINNYWAFLASEGTASSEASSGPDASQTPQLFGINGNAMSDETVRYEGFHFPVMYGDIYTYEKVKNDAGGYAYAVTATDLTKAWSYKYDITLKEDVLNGASICDIRVEGDAAFINNVKINGEQGPNWNSVELSERKFTLSSDFNSYDYATAFLIVTVNGIDYKFDLYHTGFFHFDEGAHRVDMENHEAGYYYYEVRKVTVGNSVQYWLDRNLGAKSNGLYIQNATGESALNNGVNAENQTWPYTDDSQGGYYFPATARGIDFNTEIVDDNLFDNDNFEPRLSPPGYRLPYEEEWDNIRLSSNFHNDYRNNGITTYYTSYFSLGNDDNLVFPKSRFINSTQGNAHMGDAQAGYYWTATEANGIEKDQIGSWLKVMNFNGASNTYTNGFVNRYGMSVRCVAIGGIENINLEKKPINFFVKGATHVFLYTEDKSGNKSGLFSYPGKQVANPTIVSKQSFDADNYLTDIDAAPFNTTTSKSPSELKVLFAYVDNDGVITVISRKPGSSTNDNDSQEIDSEYITTASIDKAEGWPVKNGWRYYFYWKKNEDNSLQLDTPNHHIFNINYSSSASNDKFLTNNTLTVTWLRQYNDKEFFYIFADYYEDNGTRYEAFGPWKGVNYGKGDDSWRVHENTIYFEKDTKEVVVQVHNLDGESSSQPNLFYRITPKSVTQDKNRETTDLGNLLEYYCADQNEGEYYLDLARTYRVYWPVSAGPGFHLWYFDGANRGFDSDDWWENSKFRGIGHQEGNYYYYDFVSNQTSGTFDCKFSNLDGSGKTPNSNGNQSLEKTFNITYSFKQETIKKRHVYVGYINIDNNKNPDSMTPGFPSN